MGKLNDMPKDKDGFFVVEGTERAPMGDRDLRACEWELCARATLIRAEAFLRDGGAPGWLMSNLNLLIDTIPEQFDRERVVPKP